MVGVGGKGAIARPANGHFHDNLACVIAPLLSVLFPLGFGGPAFFPFMPRGRIEKVKKEEFEKLEAQ